MPDQSNVRHDTIVVSEGMHPAQVQALAERKAHSQAANDEMVVHVHLHGARPVGDEGTEVEWRYSYQVIPAGGSAV
jgi:hypothetical protein